jgi:hypothetical protein
MVCVVALAGAALASPATEDAPNGSLSKEAINTVVRGHMAGIKYCYEVELQKKQSLAGTIEIAWAVETDGGVSQARVLKSTMNDVKVEGCIVRQVTQWKFPSAAQRTLVGRYPFIFKSGEGGAAPSAPPTVRIWVSRTGAIELDGEPVDLAAVGAALADLAKKKGIVLYGRDDPGQGPHPNGMKVVQLVIQNQLQIRLSSKRDFSDAVGADGKSVKTRPSP